MIKMEYLYNFNLGDEKIVDSNGNNILMNLVKERNNDNEIEIFRVFSTFLIMDIFDLKQKNKENKTIIDIIIETTNNTYKSEKITDIVLKRLEDYFYEDDDEEEMEERSNGREESDIVTKGKLLSEGTYGKIYNGIFKNRNIIIKMSKINSYLSSDLFKEAMITKIVNSNSLIKFLKIENIEDEFVLVVEYYNYKLTTIIEQSKYMQLEVKRKLFMRIFKEIIEGIYELNKAGFCHCDLKPENILLDSKFKVRIIDLGISVLLGTEESEIPLRGSVILENCKNYSIDMFSIGSIITMVVLELDFLPILFFNEDNIYLSENNLGKIIKLSDEDLELMENFSPFLVEFLYLCFTKEISSKDALNHELFGQKLETYEIYSFYLDFKIPKSEKIEMEEKEIELEEELNSLCFFGDLRAVDTLRSLYTQDIILDDNEDIKLDIIKSEYKYIPYKSVIKSYCLDKKLDFEESYNKLIKFILSKRNETTISEFLNN